jgi:hypothetical protein
VEIDDGLRWPEKQRLSLSPGVSDEWEINIAFVILSLWEQGSKQYPIDRQLELGIDPNRVVSNSNYVH